MGKRRRSMKRRTSMKRKNYRRKSKTRRTMKKRYSKKRMRGGNISQRPVKRWNGLEWKDTTFEIKGNSLVIGEDRIFLRKLDSGWCVVKDELNPMRLRMGDEAQIDGDDLIKLKFRNRLNVEMVLKRLSYYVCSG